MRPTSPPSRRSDVANTKRSPIESPRGGVSIARSPPFACTLVSVKVLDGGASWPVAGSAVAAATAAPAVKVASMTSPQNMMIRADAPRTRVVRA